MKHGYNCPFAAVNGDDQYQIELPEDSSPFYVIIHLHSRLQRTPKVMKGDELGENFDNQMTNCHFYICCSAKGNN